MAGGQAGGLLASLLLLVPTRSAALRPSVAGDHSQRRRCCCCALNRLGGCLWLVSAFSPVCRFLDVYNVPARAPPFCLSVCLSPASAPHPPLLCTCMYNIHSSPSACPSSAPCIVSLLFVGLRSVYSVFSLVNTAVVAANLCTAAFTAVHAMPCHAMSPRCGERSRSELRRKRLPGRPRPKRTALALRCR